MICPKCMTTALRPVTMKAVKVPLLGCPTCKGIWSEDSALAGAVGSKAALKLAIPSYAMKSDACSCPRCKVPLFEYYYPDTEVQIDACKTCKGLWFDSKEIATIRKAEKNKVELICWGCDAVNKLNQDAGESASCHLTIINI